MTDPRPTIAHVLHALNRAGAEVLAVRMATALADRFRFVFLCLDEPGQMAAELEQPVVSLERRPGVDTRTLRRMRRALREHRVNLIHAHQYGPFFYAAASRLLGEHPPILFTEHGRTYPDPRRPRRVAANRLLLKRGDQVTAVGRFVKRMLVENEGLPEERIEVVFNGISPQHWPAVSADARHTARKALGLREDQPVIAQVARLHPVKDHATAIRAFAQVHGRLPGAVLLLVGDGELRGELESLAAERHVAGAVRFLGVRSNVPELLAAADVFLLSSLSEGISCTLLEAMAMQLPVVATQVGGNPEVVVHGRTGLLSPRGDDRALAEHLYLLLCDARMRRKMGQIGRLRVLQQFDEHQMHRAYAALYARLLGQTSADATPLLTHAA